MLGRPGIELLRRVAAGRVDADGRTLGRHRRLTALVAYPCRRAISIGLAAQHAHVLRWMAEHVHVDPAVRGLDVALRVVARAWVANRRLNAVDVGAVLRQTL